MRSFPRGLYPNNIATSCNHCRSLDSHIAYIVVPIACCSYRPRNISVSALFSNLHACTFVLTLLGCRSRPGHAWSDLSTAASLLRRAANLTYISPHNATQDAASIRVGPDTADNASQPVSNAVTNSTAGSSWHSGGYEADNRWWEHDGLVLGTHSHPGALMLLSSMLDAGKGFVQSSSSVL